MTLPLEPNMRKFGLSPGHAAIKRVFDVTVALVIVAAIGWWLLPPLILAARYDTGKSGIFKQQRIGLYGMPFTVLKLRTMRDINGVSTSVTTSTDPRITRFGAALRRWKLDELPQLFNVLNGTMSFVGPRPDVAQAYKGVEGDALLVLTVRPGITGPASIRFRNEEAELAEADDPEKYNAEVVFPEKIRLNLEYIENYNLWRDVKLMIQTVFG